MNYLYPSRSRHFFSPVILYFHSHKSTRAQRSSLVSLASLQACCAIPACVQPTCCPEEKQRQSHTQIPLLGSAPALCAKHRALHLSGEREGGNESRLIISDVCYASYCDFCLTAVVVSTSLVYLFPPLVNCHLDI